MWKLICLLVGINDHSPHQPPPIDFPAAGGSYVDPVFGTTIIRITDENDGTLCANAYSYWPAFNVDNTRLLIACDDVPLLYTFDPDTHELLPDGPLYGDDGARIDFSGAFWSYHDPDVLYGTEGTRLWRVDVSQRGMGGYTLVRDFAGLFDYPFFIHQLSMAEGDQLFTFHSRHADTEDKLDAVVYDRLSDELQVFDRDARAVDETKIDKLGRFVMVDNTAPTYGWRVWDFTAGTTDEFVRGEPNDRPGGHVDMGRTLIVNSDGWNTGIQVRDYDAMHGPDNLRNLVQYLRADGSLNWTIADHVSLRSDAETFVVGSTYGGDGQWDAFEKEIYLAYTDGSGFVRLAHTRSDAVGPTSGWNYYAEPRAVVDRTGRFVVYTSDLGSSSHMDAMLLLIPEEYWPPQTPTPPIDPIDPTDPTDPSGDAGVNPGDPPSSATMTGACSASGGGRGGTGLGVLASVLAVAALLSRASSRALSRAFASRAAGSRAESSSRR